MSGRSGGPETSRTLDRGLTLLRLLADADRPRAVSDLAAELGLARPVVYRLLATLEAHHLARRDDQGRVRLAAGVLHLAGRVQPLLREAALPVLRRLAEQVGATAHLTVVDGGEALAVAVVEPSWTDFHVGYRVGARHALTRGAAGRAILRQRSSGGQAAPGFVVSTGELQAGAQGVAAPLRSGGLVEGSVGVVALGALDVDSVGPAVVAAAAALCDRLS